MKTLLMRNCDDRGDDGKGGEGNGNNNHDEDAFTAKNAPVSLSKVLLPLNCASGVRKPWLTCERVEGDQKRKMRMKHA
jgi:hypothetical protein